MIRDQLATIVAGRADPQLHYVDGLELYGEADHDEVPLPDALHPDAGTHRCIRHRFAERVLDRIRSPGTTTRTSLVQAPRASRTGTA